MGETNGPDLSGIGRELTLGQLEQALDDPAARAARPVGRFLSFVGLVPRRRDGRW